MKPLIKTIKGKIIISTLLFSFALSSFIAGISYKVYDDYLRNNLIHSAELSLQVIADTINNDLKNIFSLADWCQANTTIGEFAMYGSKNAKQKITVYEYLNQQYNTNDSSEYIQRVLVASNKKEFVQVVTIRYSSVVDVFDVVENLDYFEAALNSNPYSFSTGFVYDPFKIKNRLTILPLIRPIYSLYDSSIAGWVFVCISPELFSNAIELYHHSDTESIYLTLSGNTYLYKDGSFILTDFRPEFFESNSNRNITTLFNNTLLNVRHKQKVFYVTRPLNYADCYITREIDVRELFSQTKFFIGIIILISLFIVLAGFFMSLILNKMVNTPVSKLKKTMAKIGRGDFSKDKTIEWENEFGEIGRGINKLAESINNLMNTRLEMEKQKRDYEYQMLQSQINPHFLYNTLMSIKWMATVQNAPGIAEMVTALSRLLKNISKGTKQFVPLSEELNLLMDYYTIMKYRYGGAITIDIKNDDEKLLNCGILRFTLQPIVENAIFHGIEPKGAAGNISIHIFRNDSGDLQIDITDDGIGMDDEMIKTVLTDKSEIKSGFFRKIGISNVHNRIRLEFGEKYGLSIKSRKGSFTTVTILLPCIPCAGETKPDI
ncbi:histidine kinase [Thermoclostridium stercorarium subsp. leptospartum DSM 9219]|uniref:Histidine kinase n=2 Tax=Thermoclostridium stercorarium TaxID=1510 RepID=A0A1B1YHN3_THEST|nr:sensor histidine kinase [Thermoclostridium stercorarium]ANX00275.1 histidine kinase [Thermoclostridium stercorarium subsp. leptospartum DSM 9219]